MASDNLQRAKARLEGIPKRAIEQGWETDDPLLNETLTAIAHALIAQVEIGQKTQVALDQLIHSVTGINAQVVRREYKVPHEDMRSWAKHYVDLEMIKRKKDEPPTSGNWFTRMFRFGD